MPSGWLSPRGRVLSRAGIGVLTWVVTPDLVDEAVADGLAWEMRLRALPARLTVYFVLGLCLFSGQPYAEALRKVTAGLEKPLAAAGWRAPAVTALTAARRRVGEKPLESLFRSLCSPLSPGADRWSRVCGLLAVAWDGTAVAAPASAANLAAFGRLGGKKGGHYPQLRLAVLAACGTRALLDAACGPARGKGTGERDLAARLLGHLRAGMLLLADRGFYSWGLWNAAAATGAHLLWRVTAGLHLPVVRALPDGSWISRIEDPKEKGNRYRKNGKRRRAGKPEDRSPLPGITVRVIEFTLTITADDGRARTQRYRMITTLLDWRQAPAADLAAGYARRWAIELAYRELKTALRGPRILLSGQHPDLARQQLWAYLVIYQAIRILICRAAAGTGLDPARLSFTAALRAARDTVTTARQDMPAALAGHEAAILAAPVPGRDGRVYPRAVKTPAVFSLAGNPGKNAISQHATCTVTITAPDTATTNSHHQPKHHEKQLPSPP
jgi:Insertion element 4 transposase N-terminal/Transposase DDE domain